MIPNSHLQSTDPSSGYANKTGAVLIFESMINSKIVAFKAFLTSFTQNFQSAWNQEKVYGRIDPVATFDSTTRTINVAWDIPAHDFQDAKNNLHKCSVLIQMLYPSYSGTSEIASVPGGESTTVTNSNTIKKTPLIKLKYANLISQFTQGSDEGLLGYITSVSWNPNLEAGMFVSAEDGHQLYPKLIQLSCDFNVLHQDNIIFDGNATNPSFPFASSLTGDKTSEATTAGIITEPVTVQFK